MARIHSITKNSNSTGAKLIIIEVKTIFYFVDIRSMALIDKDNSTGSLEFTLPFVVREWKKKIVFHSFLKLKQKLMKIV